MTSRRLILAVVGCMAMMALGAGPAMAKEIKVDDDGLQCKKADTTLIQTAVNNANPGDKIKVCPGTYNEQVRIENKDNLTLEAEKKTKLEQSQAADPTKEAIIKAPPTTGASAEKAIVLVRNAHEIDITGFRITGPGPGGCDSLRYGVRVDGGGEAEIDHNRITEIRDNPFSGCQNGVAVQVGRQSESQVGTAKIDHNLIDRYQKNGVTVDGTGSSAEIDHNVVIGMGSTAVIAQNGVQVSRNAKGDVNHNEISDNLYAPQTAASTGVLLSEASPDDVEVTENDILRNDEGVYISTDGALISHNRSNNNTFDGYGLVGAPANPTTDNRVSHNFASGNGFDGVYASEDTADNLIEENRLQDNAEHDCHDDSTGPNNPPAMVANLWVKDHGETENKEGLCKDAEVPTP